MRIKYATIMAWLTRKRHFAVPKIHDRRHLIHWLHDHLHTAYFAGVYIEGHGVYAKVAGILFLLAIAAVFIKDAEH